MRGLYLHIPFCAAICNYCNFNRGLFDAEVKSRYVHALEREVRGAGERGGRPAADTIYFGGGTPSLVEPEEIGRIIAACHDAFAVAPGAEITLEANPETVDAGRLAAFRRAGVNRVSFGVQSFDDRELVRLSRLHGAGRARAALSEAREAGFDNVSLDLMMWLPGQSVAEWLASIDEAIRLAPEHISLYLLEVYPNAPLKDLMARAQWSQAPDDDAAEMYGEAMDRLGVGGYEQYELSNVARPGRRSRHNMKYWTDADWHGFGCGAHGMVEGARTRNVAATDDYIARVEAAGEAVAESRRLSVDERLGDALFMGIRLSEGLDTGAIRDRYGVDVWKRYGEELGRRVEAGLLVVEDGRLKLTRRGMLLANEVMDVFV